MTKSEIVEEITKATGLENPVVSAVVNEFMTQVKKANSKDINIYLRGFGSFEAKTRKQKVGRNITANTPLVIPAQKIPFFKPCPEYKALLKSIPLN